MSGRAWGGKELEAVDGAFSRVFLRVLGTVGQGSARRGAVGMGRVRHGKELATVDRVLATVPLRVFRHGETRHGEARHGEVMFGLVRRGLM